jgi:hypothetical protein
MGQEDLAEFSGQKPSLLPRQERLLWQETLVTTQIVDTRSLADSLIQPMWYGVKIWLPCANPITINRCCIKPFRYNPG